jgi:hypothetical protein
MRRTAGLAAVIFFLSVAVCCAEGLNISVTPKGGYIFLSKNLNLKNNYVYGGAVECGFTDRWRAEFDFIMSGAFDTTLEEKGYMYAISADTYLPYSGSVKLQSYNLNMLYRFTGIGKLTSFIKFGGGYTRLSGKIEREERTFNYGAGGTYYFPYKRYDDYETLNINAGIALRYELSDIISIHAEVYDIIMPYSADFGKLQTPYHSIAANCGVRFAF